MRKRKVELRKRKEENLSVKECETVTTDSSVETEVYQNILIKHKYSTRIQNSEGQKLKDRNKDRETER